MSTKQPKVLFVGMTPEHEAVYCGNLAHGPVDARFVYRGEDGVEMFNTDWGGSDIDIVVASTKHPIMFRHLEDRNFKGFVIPVSNGIGAYYKLPSKKEIQVFSSAGVGAALTELLSNLRQGRPPQIIPLYKLEVPKRIAA